ncbi:MAG TPA: hypothetical protein VF469_12895 [Kofleriaceae bacterium]
MKRLVLIGALFAGACGMTDDRPRTLAYITDTILAPTCASAECHSAFKRQVGDEFDTVDATRRSIVTNGLVLPDDVAVPQGSLLIQTLTVGARSILDPKSGLNVRMPYDAPMPDADIDLIKAWIAEGAQDAQCLADAQGRACIFKHAGGTTVAQLVACSADGNVVNVVMTCPVSCHVSNGNAQCGQ